MQVCTRATDPKVQTSTIDLDGALAEAEQELRQIAFRRKQLLKVVRNISQLKERRLPPELFHECKMEQS